MGLIWEIFKALGEGETPQEREKNWKRVIWRRSWCSRPRWMGKERL